MRAKWKSSQKGDIQTLLLPYHEMHDKNAEQTDMLQINRWVDRQTDGQMMDGWID